MNKEETKRLLTPEILAGAADVFQVDTLEFVGGFENIIYQGIRPEGPAILRFSHDLHRTASQIHTELHWLEYLKNKGANVCGPYPSKHGNLVETVIVGDTPLHVSVFEKALGKRVNIREELGNTKLFQAWGRATGKLHRLTRDYRLPPGLPKRADITDLFEKNLTAYIPDNLQATAADIVRRVRALPKNELCYGLIHSDIHSGNFFYDGEELHIFDFDDCCCHQLASDIAIPLYYSIWGSGLDSQEQKDEFGRCFIRHFLSGYLKEYGLSHEQIAAIPLLFRFRDCELLAVLTAEWGGNLSEKQAELIDTFKARLREGRLIVNIDWEKIGQDIRGQQA